MADGAPAILVVDDDPGFRELVAEVLSDEGYRPLAAAPADALAYAASEPLALALLDARMPGIDGPSLCRRLRAWPPTRAVPVIFVTGLPRERLILRLAGCEPWWF
ncbi:MAG: response regulator, partial [Chloroflexia bacterium]